jgi:hypothetical protein
MTSNLAFSLPTLSNPAERGAERDNPRRIEIVTSRAQRRARPRMVYALVAIGGMLGIFIAQLMLSIALSNGAYEISTLLVEKRDLGRVEGSLNEQLELVGSTQNLAANAEKLGMVGTSAPAFLRLSDGQVIGSAVAAGNSTINSSVVANSLLAGVALLEDPATASAPTAAEAAPASSTPTETDTGTGTGSMVSATPGSAESGASAGLSTSPSLTSTTGALPSPVTH